MKRKLRNLREILEDADFTEPTELAKALRVSIPTIYAWVRQGKIPYIKFDSCVRFDPADLSLWLKSRRNGRAIRCPYDQTVGRDFDDFEECRTTCPVREECCAASAQLGVR
jgi:excisionase family DNA binding protein